MADYDFDLFTIGGGSGGVRASRMAAGYGARVAIAEEGRFGGTCVNTGCTPTKTLVASAYAMRMARRGADYGFSTGEITVDMKRVKARKDEVAGASTRGSRSASASATSRRRSRTSSTCSTRAWTAGGSSANAS